jgi:fibronectin type III domain protein
VAADGADAYEVRYASTVNGTLGPWTTQLVTKTRPATTITGLTPGATYTIQVRSFADATGFSDWSDPITRIVT